MRIVQQLSNYVLVFDRIDVAVDFLVFARCWVWEQKTVANIRLEHGRGLGLKPVLELEILQKLYYLCKGDKLFSHSFYLLICQLKANTTK